MNKQSNWATGLVSFSEISAIFTLIEISNNNKKLTVNFIAKYVIKILTSIENLWQTNESNEYDDPYQEEFTCSDKVTNEIYKIMINSIYKSGKNIKNTNYLLIGYLLLALFLFIFHLWKLSTNTDDENENRGDYKCVDS